MSIYSLPALPSSPSLPTIGSFISPFDEEEPNHTDVYDIEMYKKVDSIEYYAGFVGAGIIKENNEPDFFTSVAIAFTWNPTTKEAVVRLGNFGWIKNSQEYHAIPKNLTDYRFDSNDTEDSVMCFYQKRYDYTVSVSRTMNAILNDPTCAIKVEKFTDEERKEYDAYDESRPVRSYLRCFEAVKWPENMQDPFERTEWLKKHDADAFRNLKRRLWQIESKAMNTDLISDPVDGTCYGSMDGIMYGPYLTMTSLDMALQAVTPLYYPAAPYKVQFKNGYWCEFPLDLDETDEE